MAPYIPGTTVPYDRQSAFAAFRPLIEATDGLTLRQVCAVTGLEPSTIQNWIKRGFVPSPVQKKYRERQLARILLISSLRECMKIDTAGELMALINGDTEDESDDVISEAELYDRFCRVVEGTEADGFSPARDLPGRIRREAGGDERLNDALTVMAYAYTAAAYKKMADKTFYKMKEK